MVGNRPRGYPEPQPQTGKGYRMGNTPSCHPPSGTHSALRPVLHPFCLTVIMLASLLPCINASCPAYLMFCLPPVLLPFCPAYILSFFPLVRPNLCAAYLLSFIPSVLLPSFRAFVKKTKKSLTNVFFLQFFCITEIFFIKGT